VHAGTYYSLLVMALAAGMSAIAALYFAWSAMRFARDAHQAARDAQAVAKEALEREGRLLRAQRYDAQLRIERSAQAIDRERERP
jgi:hypothetical protein